MNALQQKPDILSVMEREGVELKRRGRDYWSLCPFHEDHSPSFKVSPERQNFYCFGCGAHGDGIDFIRKRHGIGFTQALKVLGMRRGRPTLPDRTTIRKRELLKAFDAWQRDYRLSLCDESLRIHNLQHAARNRQTPLSEPLAFILSGELAKLPVIEHRLDILFSGDQEAIFRLYEDRL